MNQSSNSGGIVSAKILSVNKEGQVIVQFGCQMVIPANFQNIGS